MGIVQWHDKGDLNAAVATWKTLLKVDPKLAQQAQVEKIIEKAQQHANMAAPTQAR
jgi:cytochrome c-type biogenesis protein CcmH/NrfG